MNIKQASEQDAQTIALLGRITFTETFGHLFTDPRNLQDYLTLTFGVQKIRISLSKENNVFWLAYWDELPVGYAKLKKDSPSPFLKGQNVCQLQKIYVLKDFLSKKVGMALQAELLDYAKKHNLSRIWLSVLKSNRRAVSFYNKHGFGTLGDHTFQIGEQVFDFQAMAKDL